MKTTRPRFVDWESPTYTPGMTIHRLTIVKTVKIRGTFRYFALCRCDCGSKPKHIRLDSIQRGFSTSCGCAHTENHRTHGLTRTPLYRVWTGMRYRCYTPTCRGYRDYGGRGITVCERWREFQNFLADMGPTYQPGLSLDRIDNNGPYNPENCRWATSTQQNRNHRRSLKYTHDGVTLELHEWAERADLPYLILHERVRRLKWDFGRAISTRPIPPNQRRRAR